MGGGANAGGYDLGPANPSGNVNMMGDLVFTGNNPWILHTPNAGPSAPGLYIAPGAPVVWNNATKFETNGDVNFPYRVRIGNIGTLGINTLTLAVGGKIGARAVYVVAPNSPWPDYVFHQGYQLPALSEVERYVQVNSHLPEIPSAATIQREELDLNTMDALLLKKVEELTLYLIALQKENAALQARVTKLEH
ncbi:hypothetical protein GCM10022406_16110 [Hymenobacter algoricola]|uniref:BZIP transcription factor n=1 Tax=Hymenobacter algoricola TaxID=486267 RepID=A0ABP7MYV0_9BACT